MTDPHPTIPGHPDSSRTGRLGMGGLLVLVNGRADSPALAKTLLSVAERAGDPTIVDDLRAAAPDTLAATVAAGGAVLLAGPATVPVGQALLAALTDLPASLAAPLPQLPPMAFHLSIDLNTAVLIDLADRTVSVEGDGGLTVTRGARHRSYPTGTELPLDQLGELDTKSRR